MKRITEEIKAMVVNGLKAGKTGDQVAEEAHVSIGYVGKVRKELSLGGFDIWHRPGAISRTIAL